MRVRWINLAGVVAVLALTGCDAHSQSSISEVRVIQSVVVLDGHDEDRLRHPLSRIASGVAVDDSTLALFDGITHRVAVVRRSGAVLAQFGGEGDGPGEFRGTAELQVRDGRIYAYDQRLQRVTILDLDGGVRSTVPVANPVQLAGSNFALQPEGRLAVRTMDLSLPERLRYRSAVFNESGEVVDTIDPPVPPEWEDIPHVLEFPFQPLLVSALAADGRIYFARTDRYEVFMAEGDRLDTIVGMSEPVDLVPEERENYQAWADYISQTMPVAGRVPAVKPPIRGLQVASDGSLIVHLHAEGTLNPSLREGSRLGPGAPQIEWTEPPTYDLYDPEGVYRGRLELPLRSRLIDMRYPYLWVARSDALGVPYVDYLVADER